MTPAILYLLKLSISLGVVFLFYQFALRRLTFYNWNRWYLLGYTLLSFFVPFVDISSLLQKNDLNSNEIINWIPVIRQQAGAIQSEQAQASFFQSPWNIAGLVILTGMIFMLLRLGIQLFSFRKMLRKASMLSEGDVKLYQVNDNIIPFSFGKSVFINQQLHSETELREIIRHEFVHVRENHSMDIIWSELLCLINWFNPFAWLLKKAIRQNLEFIADNKVLQNGFGKREYQYLLLKVTGNNQYSIATPFNFSSLKKRIAMMNKLKSPRAHLLKFIFLLPVAALVLLAFRSRQQANGLSLGPAVMQDSIPSKAKIPAEILSISVMKSGSDDLNPASKKLEGKVAIKRKDGGKEIYDLNSDKSLADFEKKYGVKLEDILPPPPPPPVPVAQPEKMPRFVKHNDNNVDWVEVWVKDGEKEVYDFKVPAQKAAFEKKYGDIIILPPPPPAPAEVEVVGVKLAPVTISDGKEFKVVEDIPVFPVSPKPFAIIADGVPIAPVPPVSAVPVTLPDNVTSITIQNDKAVVKLKNGKTEEYNFSDPAQKKQFEEKYGKVPEPPTPPRVVISDLPYVEKSDEVKAKGYLINERTTADNVLYFINGKKATSTQANSLDPATISSVNVFKGDDAVSKYGAEGKNGVVEIYTKSGSVKEITVVGYKTVDDKAAKKPAAGTSAAKSN